MNAELLTSDNATDTRLFVALARLVAAGFTVDTDGQRLKVTPARLLVAAQRAWIQQHKGELVAAVSTPRGTWCIEYPRSLVTPDSGTRCVAVYEPAMDWRRVSADYPGAAAWPAPDGLNVVDWVDAGRVAS